MGMNECCQKIVRYLEYRVKDAYSGDHRLHEFAQMVLRDVKEIIEMCED